MTAQIIHLPNAAADVAAARHVLASDGATVGHRIMALTVLDMHGHRNEADAEAAAIDARLNAARLDEDAAALAQVTRWVLWAGAFVGVYIAAMVLVRGAV